MEEQTFKILIAEDDEFLRKALWDKLRREGFETLKALDGESAIQKIKEEKPDLVLLDLIMPKMNGFEVLDRISSDEKLKKIPVIILSNLGQESDVKKCLDLGAKGYLIKSNVFLAEVIEKIRKTLATK